jgi:carboxylesterase type B
VWIHGGGYVAGSKTNSGDPAGLIRRSNNGLVFVSINYRLGAFGWLSGNEFHSDGGVPNAALYDQRFALEWVRDHISNFGGDPDRVTVIGESAGGGSIMHQITVRWSV